MAWVEWIAFAVGIAVVAGTSVSVVKTMVVPRRAYSLIPRVVDLIVTWLFMLIARRMRSYDLLDRFLGFMAPTVLIITIASWLAAFVLGFALMLIPWTDSFSTALAEAGSSLFTLGFVSSAVGGATTIDVVASATGLIVVALTIAYLPTLYAVIRRREALPKQLQARVGALPWGPAILAQHHRAGALDVLPDLFAAWDLWAAEVAETHTKYPVLAQFRLPRAGYHWMMSLLAMLDAAALDLALRPSASPPEAKLFLRSGAACFGDLSHVLRLGGEVAPCVGVDDFAKGFSTMVEAGFPVEQSADEAWPLFWEERQRYGPVACKAGDAVTAPPAPWSGSRSLPARGA